jgi:hypothetical protein
MRSATPREESESGDAESAARIVQPGEIALTHPDEYQRRVADRILSGRPVFNVEEDQEERATPTSGVCQLSGPIGREPEPQSAQGTGMQLTHP